MDGVAKGCLDLASAGGLIKEDSGRWIAGFARNLGVAPVLVAKQWGALSGLELAWDLRHRKVFLEVDS